LRTFTQFVDARSVLVNLKNPLDPFGYFHSFDQAIATLLDRLRQTAGQPAATAPSLIGAVPKVFIASTGDDEENFYTRGPGQTYNQLYAAMQSSGRYELATTPAAADLIFEIRYAN